MSSRDPKSMKETKEEACFCKRKEWNLRACLGYVDY